MEFPSPCSTRYLTRREIPYLRAPMCYLRLDFPFRANTSQVNLVQFPQRTMKTISPLSGKQAAMKLRKGRLSFSCHIQIRVFPDAYLLQV